MSTSRSGRPTTGSPQRLALARERAKLSKKALAQAVGCTAREVARWEQLGASSAQLPDIAAATGVDSCFFERPCLEPVEPDQLFFRARRNATSIVRSAAAGDATVGAELYEALARKLKLPALVLPEVPNGLTAADAALALRSAWSMGYEPTPNLIQLAEAHGVRALSLTKMAQDVDAFSLWREGYPYVFLSMASTPERSRFDFARELGHLVLHEGAPCSSVEVEREADEFAFEFLMPSEALRRDRFPLPLIDTVLERKQRWGVSAMDCVLGFRRAGVLSAEAATGLFRDLSSRGFRSSEPDADQQWPRSRVFDGVQRLLGPRALAELATECGLLVSDVHSLTFGQILTPVSTLGETFIATQAIGVDSSAPSRLPLQLVVGDVRPTIPAGLGTAEP